MRQRTPQSYWPTTKIRGYTHRKLFREGKHRIIFVRVRRHVEPEFGHVVEDAFQLRSLHVALSELHDNTGLRLGVQVERSLDERDTRIGVREV